MSRYFGKRKTYAVWFELNAITVPIINFIKRYLHLICKCKCRYALNKCIFGALDSTLEWSNYQNIQVMGPNFGRTAISFKFRLLSHSAIMVIPVQMADKLESLAAQTIEAAISLTAISSLSSSLMSSVLIKFTSLLLNRTTEIESWVFDITTEQHLEKKKSITPVDNSIKHLTGDNSRKIPGFHTKI